MAIIIKTSKPTELLSLIKKSIDAKSIDTWSYDSDGDFTHTPEQWKYKGWMRPKVTAEGLYFNFLGNNKIITTTLIYAVYHGRFAEMLLNHFDDKFSEVIGTATPKSGDIITTKIKE